MNTKSKRSLLVSVGILAYVQGASVGLISVFSPIFSHSLQLNQTQIGTLIFARSIGSLATILVGGMFVDRFGAIRVLRICTLAYALAYGLSGTLNSYTEMVLVFGVLGIAYAFVDTSLYTYGVSQFPGRKRVIIMFLQFCFGLGALSYAQLAMWLADDFASHGVVFWGLAMLLAGPACILAVRRDGDSQKISQSRAVTTAGLLSKWQGVALLCLVMFFYMGSQVTTLLWVPELLHQQYSHSFSNTNKIISLFWVGTLLGRLLFSLVLDKRGESRTLLFVFVLAGSILSWSMCILSVPIFLRSIILFLIGLTTAGIYPLILDLGLSLVPSASGMITAVLMGGAQLGNAFFSKASASVVSNFGWLLGVLIPGMLLSLAALALLLGHNQLGTVQEADKPSSTGFSNDH